MTAQAFFYNAIFFTYALVLTRFYDVPTAAIGWYILPFALGNFLGPLLLGPLFDTLGRKPMIASTYALSGVLLAVSAALFRAGDARCGEPDGVLGRHVLFCLGGGERGLSDGQRELPARGARAGDRVVLRARRPRSAGSRRPGCSASWSAAASAARCSSATCSAPALMVGAACVELAIGVKRRAAAARKRRRARYRPSNDHAAQSHFVIPGRRAAASPEPMNTGLWNMGSGFAA